MTVLAPDASLFSWLSIVEINSRTMFAVVGLIGKIMAADAHILTKTHFAGCGRRKHRSEYYKAERERSKRFPNSDKAMRLHKVIPSRFGRLLESPAAHE
ncbi:hypothetical protein ACK83U_12700 [Rhizobium sp. WW22]|uniref:hypothetical protein n=1 Tax=Rhizobium sp. WW22 TaxID=3389070 RepID=UPI0013AF37A4